MTLTGTEDPLRGIDAELRWSATHPYGTVRTVARSRWRNVTTRVVRYFPANEQRTRAVPAARTVARTTRSTCPARPTSVRRGPRRVVMSRTVQCK